LINIPVAGVGLGGGGRGVTGRDWVGKSGWVSSCSWRRCWVGLSGSLYKAMISTTLLKKGVRAAHSIRLLHSTRISSMPIQVRAFIRHTRDWAAYLSAFTHDLDTIFVALCLK